MILLVSATQVARITDVSHQSLAPSLLMQVVVGGSGKKKLSTLEKKDRNTDWELRRTERKGTRI
jgi:hypothetical protein